MNMPPYTREVLNRVVERTRALFSRDENLSILSFLVFSFLSMLFVLSAALEPSGAILGILTQKIEFMPETHVPEIAGAVISISTRISLIWVAFNAAVTSGMIALHAIYELSSADAYARVLRAFRLAGRPLLNIRNGIISPKDESHPLVTVGGPGIINISSNTAVVIEENGKFRRVLGPGDHILERFERVFAVVDLRPQIVNRTINTQTRDGIPIQASGAIEFRILPGDSRPRTPLPFLRLVGFALLELYALWLQRAGWIDESQRIIHDIDRRTHELPRSEKIQRPPYPFRDRQIIRAVYGQSISRNHTGRTDRVIWTEIVPSSAARELRNALAELTLDRLTEPEDAPADQSLERTATPRWGIQSQVLRNVVKTAWRWGCVPIRFSLGRITLDTEQIDEELRRAIEEQRANTWRAEWIRRAELVEGEASAEVNRLRENARAQAQAQMIRAIIEGLPVDKDPETIRKIVILRTLEALEEMRIDPRSQQFFPSQAIGVLDLLRKFAT